MLNRDLQQKILKRLQPEYPSGAFVLNDFEADERTMLANLSYLQEHGLCDAGIHPNMGGTYSFSEQYITAKGLDFLEGDGGLSAILGTVTVRLHADTIRELLSTEINKLDTPDAEKSLIKRQLENLPEEALKAATVHLVQLGLSNLPNALPWLRALCGLG